MSLGMKGFVFNRACDWDFNSYTYNTAVKNDFLLMRNRSLFFSTLLDSGESGNSWNNLIVKSKIPKDSKLIFKIFATDSKDISVSRQIKGNNYINLVDFFSKRGNLSGKLAFFDSVDSLSFENPRNVPIFSLQGRYIIFCIESINYSNVPIEIEEVSINFPMVNFSEYLPEVYQNGSKDSFMNRFISIFQTMYAEVDEIIDNIPENFEPLYANKKFIHWICSLFNVDTSIWNDEQLRDILKNLIRTFRNQGTRSHVIENIKKYVKSDPILIEKFRISNNEFYKIEKKTIDMLFGENNYYFTVFLRESDVENEVKYANLLKIISEGSPVNSICNLVLLTDNITLGFHCYIGLNSYISNSYVQTTENNFIKLGV